MFKEGDWVKPIDGMIKLVGINVENIRDMQVTDIYSYNEEVECRINITNGKRLKATFKWEYIMLTSEKEAYSLTF